MQKRTIVSIVAFSLVLPAGALAFPFLASWHDLADGNPGTPKGRAGAGGIYGTGGATDHGITCANCHIGGKGLIGATITPAPAFTKMNGVDAYKPGQQYTITVALTGEHLGLTQGTNNLNGMGLTIEDQGGKPKGVFVSDSTPQASSAACPAIAPNPVPATGTTYLYGDCHGVLYIPRPTATQWTFNWTEPAAGSGQLTVFYGVVDGDANGKSSLDDDTKMGTLKLLEGP